MHPSAPKCEPAHAAAPADGNSELDPSDSLTLSLSANSLSLSFGRKVCRRLLQGYSFRRRRRLAPSGMVRLHHKHQGPQHGLYMDVNGQCN